MALTKMVNQAKDSLKHLGLNLDELKDTKRVTNEKILAGLKSIGVASQTDLEALEKKVEALASQVNDLLKQQGEPSVEAPKGPTLHP